jgi:hypothetical protein
MGANVYANGMEVSGGATPHNVIASMPDVCMSPPPPPAGPVPIPYPNFAQSSDLTDGSTTVLAGGEAISLKGKSSYKKSKGDEAATNSFGAGLLSHSISGSVKHKAGSMDVMVEGSSVVRNLDLTTGNHSNPGDGCTIIDTAGVAVGFGKNPNCDKLNEANKKRRTDTKQSQDNTTITHAKIQQNGKTTTVWSSSAALSKCYQNGGYASGLERETLKKERGDKFRKSDTKDKKGRKGKKASNLCNEARAKLNKNNDGVGPYKTSKSTSRPHTSHTESRILESLFANGAPPAGTKITFAIQVNKNEGKGKEDDPCDRCRRLLCAAELCDIEIKICDGSSPETIKDKTGEKCT